MELSNKAFDWNGDVQSFRELADYNDISIFDILPTDIRIPSGTQTVVDELPTTVINWFL